MRCGPPPSLILARFSRSSAVRSFMVALAGASVGVAMTDLPGGVRNLKTLGLTPFSLLRCYCDSVLLTVNPDDVAPKSWPGIAACTLQGRRFGASGRVNRFFANVFRPCRPSPEKLSCRLGKHGVCQNIFIATIAAERYGL